MCLAKMNSTFCIIIYNILFYINNTKIIKYIKIFWSLSIPILKFQKSEFELIHYLRKEGG